MAWTARRTWNVGEVHTAAQLNEQVRDNLGYLADLAYVEFTSDVSVSSTSEGGSAVVSSGAIVYQAFPIVVEFYSPAVTLITTAGDSCVISLYDGATQIGRLAHYTNPTAANFRSPCSVMRKLTPSAGSHTYQIKAHRAGTSTPTIAAGAGGVGTNLPGFIRIRGIPS